MEGENLLPLIIFWLPHTHTTYPTHPPSPIHTPTHNIEIKLEKKWIWVILFDFITYSKFPTDSSLVVFLFKT